MIRSLCKLADSVHLLRSSILILTLLGTKLLLNILLKGYIIVKKQGDRTFHITCLSENTLAGNNLDSNSRSFSSVDLTTYMIQTKQPQVCVTMIIFI